MFERIREILPKRFHPARQYCPELRIKLVSSSGISPPRRKFNNSSVEYRISYAVPRDLQVSKSRITIIRDNSSRDVDGASSALASPGFLITDRYSHQLAHPLFTCSKVAKLPPPTIHSFVDPFEPFARHRGRSLEAYCSRSIKKFRLVERLDTRTRPNEIVKREAE